MKMVIKTSIIMLALLTSIPALAQENGKFLFTTSLGLISAQGKFAKAYKSSVAFNSGIEMSLKNNWYGQFVLDYNALKYDQQIRDDSSPYLFQNTNSSLLLLGLNGGKNFYFKKQNWFTSLYGGTGYLNLGEPRVTTNPITNIARQDIVRNSNVFGRAGARLAYKTKSSFFQTLYFDASYWASPAKSQGGNVNGFSFYVGTRFGTDQ